MPDSGSDEQTAIDDVTRFDLAREIEHSAAQKPWSNGIQARALYKKPDFRAILVSMEPGARMKEHQVAGTSSVQVLKGHIRYSTAAHSYDLQVGSLITVAASIAHSVEALEESVFLLIIALPS